MALSIQLKYTGTKPGIGRKEYKIKYLL
jgi:hypothetical protein